MEARLSKFAEHQAAEEPQTPFGFSAWEGKVHFVMTSALLRQRMRAFLLVGVSLSLSGAGSNSKGCRTNANLVSLQASLSLQLLVNIGASRIVGAKNIWTTLQCKGRSSYSPRFHPLFAHREAAENRELELSEDSTPPHNLPLPVQTFKASQFKPWQSRSSILENADICVTNPYVG